MLNWLGKKAGSGAVDGAVKKAIDILSKFDIGEVSLIADRLPPERREAYLNARALLIASAVELGARKLAESNAKSN